MFKSLFTVRIFNLKSQSCCYGSKADQESNYQLERYKTIKDNMIKDEMEMNVLPKDIMKSRGQDNPENKQSIISFVSFQNKDNHNPQIPIKEKTWGNSNEEVTNNDESVIMKNLLSDKEILSYPYLELEEIEGDYFKGSHIQINAGGMVNGERKAKDGIAFFGNELTNGEDIIMDSVIDINYDNVGPFLFIIYFHLGKKKYYMRTYKEEQEKNNATLLVQITQFFPITRKEYLFLGGSVIQVSSCGTENILQLVKFPLKLNDTGNSKNYYFKPEDSPVTIGRDRSCNIVFYNDRAYSRFQTTFIYDSRQNIWTINDGCNERESTNGTWLYAFRSFEIKDHTIFRIGSSKVKISIKNYWS